MDLRERINDDEEMIRSAIEQALSNLWTSAPARVLSFDPGGVGKAPTVSLQITTKGFIKQPDGTQKAVDLPVLQSVPVQFPSGGGMNITFPIAVGDEGMVTFTSRSPDSWQQSGGDQQPPDAATHGLSNGYFQPGLRANPRAIPNISTTQTEIRSDDGNTKVGLSGAGGVSIATDKQVGISAANGVSITGGEGDVNFTGTLRVDGEIILNGIHLSTHKHTDVQPGGGMSGGPTD